MAVSGTYLSLPGSPPYTVAGMCIEYESHAALDFANTPTDSWTQTNYSAMTTVTSTTCGSYPPICGTPTLPVTGCSSNAVTASSSESVGSSVISSSAIAVGMIAVGIAEFAALGGVASLFSDQSSG